MEIKAFSTLGEISHFAISGYFVISGFDITGVDCTYNYNWFVRNNALSKDDFAYIRTTIIIDIVWSLGERITLAFLASRSGKIETLILGVHN